MAARKKSVGKTADKKEYWKWTDARSREFAEHAAKHHEPDRLFENIEAIANAVLAEMNAAAHEHEVKAIPRAQKAQGRVVALQLDDDPAWYDAQELLHLCDKLRDSPSDLAIAFNIGRCFERMMTRPIEPLAETAKKIQRKPSADALALVEYVDSRLPRMSKADAIRAALRRKRWCKKSEKTLSRQYDRTRLITSEIDTPAQATD